MNSSYARKHGFGHHETLPKLDIKLLIVLSEKKKKSQLGFPKHPPVAVSSSFSVGVTLLYYR